MKVAQLAVPVAFALVATTSTALAGPQSALDPYANIKAPTTKEVQDAAKKAAEKAEKKKPKPYAVPTVKNPAADLHTPALGSKPEKIKSERTSAVADDAQAGGVKAGTKQIFHGIGTAGKGAASDVLHPVKSVGTGIANGGKAVGQGVAKGGKAVEEKVAKGAKTSEDAVKDGAKKVGAGVKEVGTKVKDGSQAAGKAMLGVPKKIGEGLKATREKIANGGLTKGVASAAQKTGETTRKVAAAPFKLAAKLNPFHHKDDAVQTASAPQTQK